MLKELKKILILFQSLVGKCHGIVNVNCIVSLGQREFEIMKRMKTNEFD